MPHSGRILCRDVIPSPVRGGGPRRAYRTRGLRMRHGIIFRSRTGLRIFGPKATSAVMLSEWENGALLFVWILTIKRFVLFQRYKMIPKVQSILYTSQSDSLRKHESLSCENRCK